MSWRAACIDGLDLVIVSLSVLLRLFLYPTLDLMYFLSCTGCIAHN